MHAHACYIVAWGTKLRRVWKQKYFSYQIFQIEVKTWFLKGNSSYMNLVFGMKNKLQKVCSNFCSTAQRPNVLAELSSFTEDA